LWETGLSNKFNKQKQKVLRGLFSGLPTDYAHLQTHSAHSERNTCACCAL
jgi:hypothetical protein